MSCTRVVLRAAGIFNPVDRFANAGRRNDLAELFVRAPTGRRARWRCTAVDGSLRRTASLSKRDLRLRSSRLLWPVHWTCSCHPRSGEPRACDCRLVRSDRIISGGGGDECTDYSPAPAVLEGRCSGRSGCTRTWSTPDAPRHSALISAPPPPRHGLPQRCVRRSAADDRGR